MEMAFSQFECLLLVCLENYLNGVGLAHWGQFNGFHQAVQSIAEWYFERLSWRLALNAADYICVCGGGGGLWQQKVCQGWEDVGANRQNTVCARAE